jgi:hypothetical protein
MQKVETDETPVPLIQMGHMRMSPKAVAMGYATI